MPLPSTPSTAPSRNAQDLEIAAIPAKILTARLVEFGGLLHACVEAGASVNYVLPLSASEAEDYWRKKILPGLEGGKRIVLTADIDGRLAGTVNLDLDTPPNQVHRAEVSKLLVHPDFRRRGIARALMGAIETHAKSTGRTLLTLDTLTGDNAELLYGSIGYAIAGIIPGYCRDAIEDRLCGTTIMYKKIGIDS